VLRASQFTNVVMSLVQGVVLFNMATNLVDFVARRALREHLLARAVADGEQRKETTTQDRGGAWAEARQRGGGPAEDSAAELTPGGDRIFAIRPRDALSLTCAQGRPRVAGRPATLRDAARQRSSRRAISRVAVAPRGRFVGATSHTLPPGQMPGGPP